jgi:2-oxoglutarate ferredoxin oxidoreductase subunit beta
VSLDLLETYAQKQWCQGCGNFGILESMRNVLEELHNEGFPLEKIVMVAGIGQHAKMADYVNINSFYSIHGRVFPAATAIKLANPDLKVICFAGDGDSYAEGLDHLIFAAKRNIDITAIIHDNRVYALATGQFTPTSPKDFKGTTTPFGSKEYPFNPLELMLTCGASFIGRGYPVRGKQFQKLIKDAIMHRGFSFVDTLQVCATYNNLYDFYNKNVQEFETSDPTNYEEASKIIRSWDYNSEGMIPIGKFYEIDRPGFEEFYAGHDTEVIDRDARLKEMLEKFI